MSKAALSFYSVAIVLLAAVPLLPLGIFRFATALLFVLLWHVILAESYDLVGGHMGYINLGHATFFGIGGYAFGIIFNQGVSLGAALLAGTLVAVVFAAFISMPFFRLKGAYFALASFGLVVLLELVATNLRDLTGGSQGLYIRPGFRDVPAYYAALAIAAGAILTNFFVTRSGFGLALASIREDEEAAQSFGISPLRYKALALMVSAFFAGLMGAVFVWKANYADPPLMFGLEKSLVPVVMAMLGGSGTVMGPVVGAIFLTGIEEFLWTKLPYLHLTVYGIILALVGLFMPGGLTRGVPLFASRYWRLASRLLPRANSK